MKVKKYNFIYNTIGNVVLENLDHIKFNEDFLFIVTNNEELLKNYNKIEKLEIYYDNDVVQKVNIPFLADNRNENTYARLKGNNITIRREEDYVQ